MKGHKGITLLALTITIIIMFLIAGTTISLFGGESIIKNSKTAVEQSTIESKKNEIEQIIIKTIKENDKDITKEDIIEELVNEGIINEGDGNSDNGQVKTQPDGYIYEIKEEANGNWKVEYVGKGEIDKSAITISVTENTTGIATKVTLKIKGSSLVGITEFTPPIGTTIKYNDGTTKIEETIDIATNGTYNFTIKNKEGKIASKTITINNIITGIITISATPTNTMTKDDVTITVTWPSGASTATKQISTNGGTSWKTYTGDTSTVKISSNCTVKARITSGSEEIKSATLTINNIDKTKPTVTAKQASVTITEGDSNELSTYFTIVANGSSKITSIKYVDTSNSNSTVTNTNTLSKGTHIIKCTATKETGTTASATVTIEVKNKQTITSADYGATINGYNCENSAAVANWKIFYADEDNVYIIADNYINVDYVPNAADSENNGWEIVLRSDYTGSEDITDTRIQNLNKSYFDYLKANSITTTDTNIQETAYLTDINAWSVFAGEEAEYAIGGPTIELFFKSYNQKYNTNLQAKVSDWRNLGYIWYGVSDDGGETWNGHLNDILLNTDDSLYIINEESRAEGMYLSSPAQARMAMCLCCLVYR